MKAYLGDSVYVDVDAGGLQLTTENGRMDDPSNRIFVEAEVFAALVRYVMFAPELKEWRQDAVRGFLNGLSIEASTTGAHPQG